MADGIRVLYFPPNEPAVVRSIGPDEQDLKVLVGGWWDRVRVSPLSHITRRLYLHAHNEGLLLTLENNVWPESYEVPLRGPVVLAAEEEDQYGDFSRVSLTVDEIEEGRKFWRWDGAVWVAERNLGPVRRHCQAGGLR